MSSSITAKIEQVLDGAQSADSKGFVMQSPKRKRKRPSYLAMYDSSSTDEKGAPAQQTPNPKRRRDKKEKKRKKYVGRRSTKTKPRAKKPLVVSFRNQAESTSAISYILSPRTSMKSVGAIAIRPSSSSRFFDQGVLFGSDHVDRLGSRVETLVELSTYTTQTLSPNSESAMYATLLGLGDDDEQEEALGKVETLLGDCFSSRLSSNVFTACRYRLVNEAIRRDQEERRAAAAAAVEGDEKEKKMMIMKKRKRREVKSDAVEHWVRRSSRRAKERVLFSPERKRKRAAEAKAEVAKQPELAWDIESCKRTDRPNLVVGFLARNSVLRPSVVVREMSADFLFLYSTLRRKVRPSSSSSCSSSSSSSSSSNPKQVGSPPIYGTRLRLEMYVDELVFKDKCSARERAELLLCTRALEAEVFQQLQSLNLMSLLFKVSLVDMQVHPLTPDSSPNNRNGVQPHSACPCSRLW